MTGYAAGPYAPPRRRRRWPLRLAIALVVLLALLLVADRVAVRIAEHTAADRIEVRAPFDTPPTVTVHGFPFLTQAVGGTYDDIEVRGSGLHLGDVAGATLDAHLRGAKIPPGDVLKGDVTALPCRRVDGTVTLPYSELARLTGIPGLVLSHRGNEVSATARPSVTFLGQTLAVTISGRAVLSVEGNRLHFAVTALSVGSASVPSAALPLLNQALDVPIALPSLPYGLAVDSITPQDAGVAIGAAADDVTLQGDP